MNEREQPEDQIRERVVEQLDHLPQKLQKKVLEYVKVLRRADEREASGKDLLRFAGSIPAEDLKIIREVIERDCERIDIDEW